MRGLTVAVVAVVVVVVAAAIYLRRGEEAGRPMASAPAAKPQPQASAKSMERSARVEERLGQLREDFDHRQAAGAEPAKREVPTLAAEKRKAMEAKEEGDDEGDDEDPQEMAELKHTLLTDPDPDERIGAVLMLTGEEGPESLSMLLEAMGDPDAEVRLAVVEALGDRSEELSPDTLDPAMKDTDPEVRFEAVSILGDMEDNPEAMQKVRNALNDPDDDVRTLAEGILDFSENPPGQAKPQPAHPQNAQPQHHM
jgi:HEAT repeat protein